MALMGGAAAAPGIPPPPPPPPVPGPTASVVGLDAYGHPTIKGGVPDVSAKPEKAATPKEPSKPGQLGNDLKNAVGGLFFMKPTEPGKPGPSGDGPKLN